MTQENLYQKIMNGDTISNEDLRYTMLSDDLRDLKEKYGDERRSK